MKNIINYKENKMMEGMEEMSFCQQVSEKEKHEDFSQGYFAYLARISKTGRAMAGYIVAFVMLGIVFNIPLWGAVADIVMVLMGKAPLNTATWVITAVALVWLGLASLLLRVGKKRANRTREDWMKEAAGDSALPDSVIADFDEQVRQGEIQYLTLRGKKERENMLLMTKDYIMHSTGAIIVVIPIQDIVGACYTYYTNMNNKRIRYLTVGIVTKKAQCRIEAKQKYADGFFAFLKERVPSVQIISNRELSENDFFSWTKELQK